MPFPAGGGTIAGDMPAQTTGFYFSLTAACCIAIACLSYFSEVTDIFYGIGTDGIYYFLLIPDLTTHLKDKTFIAEAADRLLPMGVAHVFYNYLLKAWETVTEMPLGNCSIRLSDRFVLTFQLLNSAYLMSGVAVWSRICYKLGISNSLFALSLGLLLANFMFLKQFFFEPVFLDQSVFFFAVILLYAVLFSKRKVKYCLIFCSFFVNKLAMVITLLMVLLNSGDKKTFNLRLRRNYLLLAWLMVYLAMTLFLIYRPLCVESQENKTMHGLMAISVAGALGYTLFCWAAVPPVVVIGISRDVFSYLAMAAAAALQVIIVKFFSTKGNLTMCDGLPENPVSMVLNFVRQANSRPLGFLSSHYDYFGLIVPFAILFASRIKNFLAARSGWALMFLCFSVVSINAESRYLTLFLPFFAWMLIAHRDGSERGLLSSGIATGVVCLWNVIWSGCLRRINPLGTENYFDCKEMLYDNLFIDPLQKYFRHLGPWTSDESYYFQLAVFIGTLPVIYLLKNFFRSNAN